MVDYASMNNGSQ